MLEFLTLNTALKLLGVCVFIKLSNQVNQMVVSRKPASTEDYLFKIARITGTSEYDIFIKQPRPGLYLRRWSGVTSKNISCIKRFLTMSMISFAKTSAI